MRLQVNRKIKIFVSILIAWFIVHSIYIGFDGLRDYKGDADVAIVLGNEVYADSSVSLPLKGRLDKALELYITRRVKKIYVSGGQVDNWVAEGDAMKSYLVKWKVVPGDIIADNQGSNTYFTAKDFIALNDSLHFTAAIAVTSFYHITRA